MRSLEELIDGREPAWPAVQEWLDAATNPVTVLPVDQARADEVLTLLQVTTRSPMGAIAHGSGGMVIDGWVRILGGGGPRMRGDLAQWNGLGSEPLFAGVADAFVVAVDLLGGVFAVMAETRHVSYFSPDTLSWENLGVGYSELVESLLRSDLDVFFDGLRWPTWREETAQLHLDRGIHVHPPLWTRESREKTPSRRDVPLPELVALHFDFAQNGEFSKI